MQDEFRFWSKVDQSTSDHCWQWCGSRNAAGYGNFFWQGRVQKAHRVSVIISGRDPTGFLVLHSCDNPSCVNPSHLRIGTQRENMRDMEERGRANRATGLRNGQHTQPHRRAIGLRSGAYTHPEAVNKGIKNGRAKLTEDAVRKIRQSSRTGPSLAAEYGVTTCLINLVKRRVIWTSVL